MSPDQRTQAAAQRCADLANAVRVEMESCPDWIAGAFLESHNASSDQHAFRRYVEHIDARDREWDALLERGLIDTVLAKLRANLLPDEKPTLLEEFMAEVRLNNVAQMEGAAAFADWIAKRQENEG